MLALFDWIKLGTGFAVGAMAGAALFYAIGNSRGFDAGYSQAVSEIAVASGKAELERKNDDAQLQRSDDYDLCLIGLRSSGVSDTSACNVLRIRQEQP